MTKNARDNLVGKEGRLLRIAFLGRGRQGMKVLESLLREPDVSVVLVGTCRPTPEVGFQEADFAAVADGAGIPFFATKNLNTPESVAVLKDARPDLGVSMSWVHTIAREPIETAKLGFLNVHGGLLPKYRGNACQSWAILNGESEIGITCHLMEPGRLDSGPIILQETIAVTKETTVGDLYQGAEKVGARLVMEAVRGYASGNVKLREQNSDLASYCYPRLPRDGEIDWQDPGSKIFDLVRAAGPPYPGAFSYFHDVREPPLTRKLSILSAHLEAHPLEEFYAVPGHLLRLEGGSKWAVVTGDKTLLVLDEVLIDDEKIAPAEWFKSVRQRLGLDVQGELVRLRKEVDRLSKLVEST